MALALAVFAGFALGAHLVFVIGFGFELREGFYSFVQTHGHLQLIGWAGLFIIGISLHFIPRLTGAAISRPQWIRRILWLIAAGLILRGVGNSILPYVTETAVFAPLTWIVSVSGMLEWAGVLGYLYLLFETFRRSGQPASLKAGKRVGAPLVRSVYPFFGMMMFGWLLYSSLNAILLVQMSLNGSVVLDRAWNHLAITLFTGLVLLPVSFAFSVRMLPLYLRLPAPRWGVGRMALLYLLSFCLEILPTVPAVQDVVPDWSLHASLIGKGFKGAIILWFIWSLDVLTRRREPWTANRTLSPDPGRRPTREGVADYGEFGRFELLVFAAYLWLALGALLEVLTSFAFLLGLSPSISSDVVRHIYLLGFITHLIFGMSVRMIPGFIGKREVASRKLVSATLWLGTMAAISRVVPLLLPSSLLDLHPLFGQVALSLFALSGIWAILAVVCLAVNLWKTRYRCTIPSGFW